MAKKKQKLVIPFSEIGIRKFKNVNEAVDYFKSNLDIDARETYILFQNSFNISVGKWSINVSNLQDLNEAEFCNKLSEMFKNQSGEAIDKLVQLFSVERKEWMNKFKD